MVHNLSRVRFMNQQTNIENYRRSFNIMAKNLDNNLKDYLTEHKMTKIELLLSMGLNTKLVTEFNYTELEKLVSLILTDEEFPIITNHSEVIFFSTNFKIITNHSDNRKGWHFPKIF